MCLHLCHPGWGAARRENTSPVGKYPVPHRIPGGTPLRCAHLEGTLKSLDRAASMSSSIFPGVLISASANPSKQPHHRNRIYQEAVYGMIILFYFSECQESALERPLGHHFTAASRCQTEAPRGPVGRQFRAQDPGPLPLPSPPLEGTSKGGQRGPDPVLLGGRNRCDAAAC